MDFTKILIGALAGTSFMTAFSYLMSASFRKLFKEPVLLQYVMRLLHLNIGAYARWFLGWLIHYSIGVAFVFAYDFLRDEGIVELNVWSSLVFGAAIGIIGILGWMVIFRLPSDEPRVDYKNYYLQLFVAHLIFALSVWAVYELI